MSASSGVAGLAKQDAWVCALFSAIIGLAFVWMYYYLGVLYPGKTFVEILMCVLGKWLGWIISAAFVLFVCFLDVAEVIFYVGEFIQAEYMTETPLYALNLLLVAGIVIGLYYGLEAIARSAEILIVIVTILIMVAMLLNLPNIKVENLLPVFEEGITPVLKGSLYLSSYMTWPLIVLNMIYPSNVNEPAKSRKSMFTGFIFGSSINFICTIMAILVLGSTITARSNYPTYLLTQEVNIGIITRIEGVMSGAWIITQFIKILLYFYAGLIGLAQLFGLKDHKKCIGPLALVMLVYSGVIYPNSAYQIKWDSTTWIPFIATFSVVLPLFLLIMAIPRKLIERKMNTVVEDDTLNLDKFH